MRKRQIHGGAAIWAVLAVSILSGCGPAPVPEEIDLLALCPPLLEAAGHRVSRAPLLDFDFSEGLPRGVTAGPAGVRLTTGSGGLLLEADQAPWIEFRASVDPLRYKVLRARLGPSDGKQAELYYDFAEPPNYSLINRIAVELKPDPGRAPCIFQLPQPDAVGAPLQVLRLYPGGRGSTRGIIRRLELVPRGPQYLGQKILGRELVELGQDYRRCWRFRGADERVVEFRVPGKKAVLHFSSGVLAGGDGARLRVLLQGAGGAEEELWSGAMGPVGRGWSDHRFELGHLDGETVTLRFVVETAQEGVFLVGNPKVRLAPDPQEPGVLVVLIDTVRADRTSTYGHRERSTPHLDRLSRGGVLFSQVSAPSSWTLPSTAALLTGRYPDELGVREGGGPAVPDQIPTLAERLSGAGFTCGGFVANFVLSPFRSFARGFDSYYVAPFSERLMRAGQLNRLALDWVAEHRDERLFCYVHYMDPHSPYDAPMAGDKADREFDIEHGHRWQEGDMLPLIMGWQQVSDPEDVAAIRHLYDEEIVDVDRQLGALLAGLHRLGVLENMVVVVTSDHGEEFLDHGNWSHGLTLYQEMLHVPMVLRGPGLEHLAGSIIHRPVTLVDVAPTIAALCGLSPAAEDFTGGDLLDPPDQRTLYSLTTAGQAPLRFGVIQGRYKYAFFDRDAAKLKPPTSVIGRGLMRNGPPREGLFDLQVDPLEQENLILSRPDLANRLREEMHRRLGKAPGSANPPEAEPEIDPETAERLRALGYME